MSLSAVNVGWSGNNAGRLVAIGMAEFSRAQWEGWWLWVGHCIEMCRASFFPFVSRAVHLLNVSHPTIRTLKKALHREREGLGTTGVLRTKENSAWQESGPLEIGRSFS